MLIVARCPVCGRSGAAPCRRCAAAIAPPDEVPAVAGIDRLWALTGYHGPGRAVVTALKYRDGRAVVPWLADALAPLVEVRCDLVTWVPASPVRRRDRGYDQGRLLARAVATRLGLRCRRLLRRRAGTPQTDRGRRDRLAGPDLVAVRPAPDRLLLVDDVVTTGCSIRRAAEACRATGCSQVFALVTAVTPTSA